MHSKFARVIIDRSIHRELDYAVPESLSARVGVGSRVRVPFREKSALATVVALLEETEAKGIRPIEAVMGEGPTLSEPLLELARWIANYYCCPIEAVMRSLLPQVIRRAEVGWKKQLFVEIGSTVTGETMETLRRRAPRQAELLEELTKTSEPIPAAEILRRISLDDSTLRALEKRGLVKITARAVARDPHADEQFIPGPELLLNEEQTAAFAMIVQRHFIAGESETDFAPWRDRQRENGDLFAGNSRNPEAKSHRHRARAGNFAHAANGRAFQKPLRRIAGRRGSFAQSFIRRRAPR